MSWPVIGHREVFPPSLEHNPGGKSLIPLPPSVRGYAEFGGDQKQYRYSLERVWDESRPTVLFVMMNPSTASPAYDDPTVAKCRRYAQAWGYGRLFVGNTFAYRATDQKRLLEVEDPVGMLNLRHLRWMAEDAHLVVFAYGKPHKSLRERAAAMAGMVVDHVSPREVHVLKLCGDGTPMHPLYLRGDLKPTVWTRNNA